MNKLLKGSKRSRKSYTIAGFLKFGKHEHIEDMYRNGTIYMNPIEEFRKWEAIDGRGDPYEGATRVINSLPGSFTIPGIDRPINYQRIHLKESYDEVLDNLYCLYCISSHDWANPSTFNIDERMREFGDYCLLVKDNRFFLDAIRAELKLGGYKFHEGFVHYYDKKKVCKELTLFDKPMEYEYQKEFRFYVKNDVIVPVVIHIGSMIGKAEVLPIDDIMTLTLQRCG